MCCSIRAAIFFVSSLHLFFAISFAFADLPLAVTSVGEKTLPSIVTVVFLLFYFSSGFMIFRGSDEESATLIKGGASLLAVIVSFRFTMLFFNLTLRETLPEAPFLYAYGSTVPMIFITIMYIVYLAVLFCYHNELQHEELTSRTSARNESPINFHSPRHLRHSQGGGPDSLP